MQFALLFLFILFFIFFLLLFYFIYKKISQLENNKVDTTLLEWIKSMQQTLTANSQTMTKVLQENAKQLNDRLDKAAIVMKDVNQEIGKMSEIGRSMQDLQDFLKSPKLRGNLGEHILKDLISQIFPKNTFFLQYSFQSGDRVDVAIKTDAGILTIDAKFPMENFQKMIKIHTKEEKERVQKDFSRDIKRHIDAIAKKYILPQEGTMDFSLMYVPSEAVFYEIISMDDIIDYAKNKRVFIVSPSTLYAHLQAILLSFEGKKIEQRAKEVFQLLRALQVDYSKVTESIDMLGKHLTHASSQYVHVHQGFKQLGQKLASTKQIDKPEQEKISD